MVLALMVSATYSQAAMYTFEGMGGVVPSSFDQMDDGITATFDEFVWVYPNPSGADTLDHYLGPWAAAIATISFDTNVILDNIEGWTESNFSASIWLDGVELLSGITDISTVFGMTIDAITATGDFGISKVEVSATPLPGAFLFLGTGLVGLVGIRRRFVS